VSYDRALSFSPNDYSIWHNRGAVLSELNRPDDALASYEKAISLNPNDHKIWNSLGADLYSLDRYLAALNCFERSIQLKYDTAMYWTNRGNALRHLGQLENAIASYSEALSIDPAYAQAQQWKSDLQQSFLIGLSDPRLIPVKLGLSNPIHLSQHSLSHSDSSGTMGFTSLSFKIALLKALEKSRLTTRDLAYTINQAPDETQKIIQDLWQEGLIDELNASPFFILFPGLRNAAYRQRKVAINRFLTLTSKGYFSLYPMFKSSESYA
jgi:tetratricopeptide (TPR) repeat protein